MHEPILKDPASLDTVAELRTALSEANEVARIAAMELFTKDKLLQAMASDLSDLVVAYLKKDNDAVSAKLADFCRAHVRVVPQERGAGFTH